MMADREKPADTDLKRDKTGRFTPGTGPGPGRRPGGEDRVSAVLEAISKKAGKEGHEGLVLWLSGLPDDTLAGLFGKLLPKDVNLGVESKLTWEDWLRRVGRAPCAPGSEERLEEDAAPERTAPLRAGKRDLTE